ncbi:MAG: RNA deprotection pyrophosphohydrolase [Bacillus sp. (in: firmicutes)]
MIYTFSDVQGCEVKFSTDYHPFSSSPQHVLVIVHSPSGWVMTKHKKRGLEFPGGKLEKGETIEQAAIREAWEETGAIIKKLHYIGQYSVNNPHNSFVKDIYFAQAESIEKKKNYLETNGPTILEQLPHEFDEETYSFIMRDKVVKLSLQVIKDKQLI